MIIQKAKEEKDFNQNKFRKVNFIFW